MAISLSPLTGIPGVSNFGGHFGAYLKYAGFDALVLTGKAPGDVMFVIDSFRRVISIVEIPAIDEVFSLEEYLVDASWGKDTRSDRSSL
jgi:aldehyde:ferredoxin oxidoreductase